MNGFKTMNIVGLGWPYLEANYYRGSYDGGNNYQKVFIKSLFFPLFCKKHRVPQHTFELKQYFKENVCSITVFKTH